MTDRYTADNCIQVWPTWPYPSQTFVGFGCDVSLSRDEFERLIRENERLKIENERLKQGQAKKR
jgi:hypothetical protein